MQRTYVRRGGRRGGGIRLIIGLAMAAFALFSYFGSKTFNPVTGEEQYLSLTPKQEIALGLQATPEMIQQFGGLYPDDRLQQALDAVGFTLVQNSAAADTEWQFEFYLLADAQTVNAFALPGGQVFITKALFDRLESKGQLAGVLGHEIGHVVARHSAQQMAQQELTQGLLGAVVTASSDPNSSGSAQRAAQIAAMVGNLVNMKFGREDELQSDRLGVQFMADSGYDPRALIGVMQILEAASGGGSQPEFLSTHPNPGNRVAEIEAAIAEMYPNGMPEGMTP